MVLTRLFEPINIGPRTLRNRTMHVAISTGFAEGHAVSDRLWTYWRARADGGVGAIVSGLTPVLQNSVHKDTITRNASDADLPAMERFADAVGGGGATSIVQLVHNGSQLMPGRDGPIPLSPSGVTARGLGHSSRALTRPQIKQIIRAFGDAAVRCRRAGVDGVEVHGAHGFLIHQFLSPLTNQRDDEYGGSHEARMRFAIEALRQVRDRVGDDLIVGFRMVMDEFATGGVTPDDAIATAARLVELELVDYLSVSGGNYSSLEHGISPYLVDEGNLTPLAGRLRQAVGVPVVACNGIVEPQMAEDVLRDGLADIIGLGRALIADPTWPERARTGTRPIPCIGCNTCFAGGGVTSASRMECSVNPNVGLATEGPESIALQAAGDALQRKRFVVVGAGVAGLAFGLEASRLGHEVALFDAASVPGGQVASYGGSLTRGRFDRYVSYAVDVLAERGIGLTTDTCLSADDLVVKLADPSTLVIVATGSEQRTPSTLPVQGVPVLTGREALEQIPQGRILVVGEEPGPEPALLAAHLAEEGREVEVVTSHMQLSMDVEGLTRRTIEGWVQRGDVIVHTSCELHQVDAGQVVLREVYTGHLRTRQAVDAVVYCGTRSACDRLVTDLAERGFEDRVTTVGDVVLPRRLVDATTHAYQAARKLGGV